MEIQKLNERLLLIIEKENALEELNLKIEVSRLAKEIKSDAATST